MAWNVPCRVDTGSRRPLDSWCELIVGLLTSLVVSWDEDDFLLFNKSYKLSWDTAAEEEEEEGKGSLREFDIAIL